MKTPVNYTLTTLVLLALSTVNSAKRRAVAWRRRINPNQLDAMKTFIVILAFFSLASTAFAQGTAFSYSGQLQNNGSPASGTYNLTFTLFNVNSGGSAVAGPVTNNGVVITNGLFTVVIDFGSGVFTGATNWLEIGVETNGVNTFTTLAPRQELTPAPYAIFAEGASNLVGALPAAQLTGTIPLAQLPVEVVTNTETDVTLGNLTVDGVLNLPPLVTINSGGSSLVLADVLGDFYAGQNAGSSNAIGSGQNTGVGDGALDSSGNPTGQGGPPDIGNDNTAVGFYAIHFSQGGSLNTAIGAQALYNNTIGVGNVANGYLSLFANTTGNYNTANGYVSLNNNTDGNNNTANGDTALLSNTTGSRNTATGDSALFQNIDGWNNTANGYQALYANTNGNDNTATGFYALYFHTTGDFNTAVGLEALLNCYTGHNNIGLGAGAGSSLTTGSWNIEIGNVGSPTDDSTILIGTQGTQTSASIAGIYGATVASGVQVYVNSSGQLGTITSSQRFKQNIHNMGDASEVLYSLKPVTFRYKPGIDPQGIPQFGLVAEDVEKVAPDLVARDDQGKIYTVRYQAVDTMLLNEFLKEHRTVEEQNGEIETLKQRLAALEKIVLSQKSN